MDYLQSMGLDFLQREILKMVIIFILFLLVSFFFSLGFLDDTNSDGLFHVSNSESTEGRVFLEHLTAEGFSGNDGDKSGITVFDELRVFFKGLSTSSVDFVMNCFELASNMGSVTVKNGGISVLDLTRVIHDDNLGVERRDFLSRVILSIGSDISSADIFV